MMKKSEELCESGTALYSGTPCVVVPLASTSLTWSDRTVPRLRPLQLCPDYRTVSRLRPLQLLLPDCIRFQLLFPDCVRFSCCCSSASACYHAHAVQIKKVMYGPGNGACAACLVGYYIHTIQYTQISLWCTMC